MKERRALIDPKIPLSVRRQCELLTVSRSGWYYEPVGTSSEDLELMRRIDALHLQYPFLGSGLFRECLMRVNDRDTEKTRENLEEVQSALGESTAVEAMLFGGSVSKHRYVYGLSDVDALVVLDRARTQGVSSQHVLEGFHRTLDERLSRDPVASVKMGALAVTVLYRDGSEVQLLPAVRKGSSLAIPDASGSGWRQTDPRRFQRKLSRQNERLGRALVPTIELVKSLVGDLPKQQRISGYHAEALCLDAAKEYRGEATPKALLAHVLEHSSKRVLRSIQDVTGQSRTVDADLGPENSPRRRLAAQALAGIRRRLQAATSVQQWKAMFGRGEEWLVHRESFAESSGSLLRLSRCMMH